jgi:hypothetical protein
MTHYLRHRLNDGINLSPRRTLLPLVAASFALNFATVMPSGAATVQHGPHANPPPSPATLISRIRSAIASVDAVHLTVKATQTSPKISETISQDAGLTSGSQNVISGNERASVLLTKTNAYLSGNSSGLSAFFALPADDQTLVGTKWILIKAGSKQYTSFVSSITVKHLLTNLLPTSKSLSVHNTMYGTIPTYEIDWSITSSGSTTKLTLTLPRTGAALPFAESAISGTTAERSVLTKWNKPVTIHAPANTIAITKLHPS